MSPLLRIYDDTRTEEVRVSALGLQQVLDAPDLVLQPGFKGPGGGPGEGRHRSEAADGREKKRFFVVYK